MRSALKYLVWTYGVLLLVGAILYFAYPLIGRWVFAAGAVVAIVTAFAEAIVFRSEELAVARRHRLFFIASLFLGVSAWYMFIGSNNWVVFTLIWAVIALYLSLRK